MASETGGLEVEEEGMIRCPPTQAAHSKATPRDEHMAVSRNDSHKICPQAVPHPSHIGTPLPHTSKDNSRH